MSLPTNTTVAPLFKKYVATDLPIPLDAPVYLILKILMVYKQGNYMQLVKFFYGINNIFKMVF